jgi:hypothetical protein
MRSDRSFALFGTIVAALLVASGSSAQNKFSMTGKAASGAGLFIRIPLTGPSPCPSLTAARTGRPTMSPQDSAIWDAHPAGSPTFYRQDVVLNPDGCMPGGPAVVTTNGTGGFTFPAAFFNQPAQGATAPIPDTPFVVQLYTNWTVTGPPATRAEPASGRRNANPATPTFASAPLGAFKHSAWTNQTGRRSTDFTACPAQLGGLPGAPPPSGAKVSCTYPKQGQIPGYVKVTGGPNGGFGGTFGLVLNTPPIQPPPTAPPYYQYGDLAFKTPGGNLQIAPLQGMGSRPAGRGYAAYSVDYLAPGQIWSNYMLTGGGGPSALISMVSGYVGPAGYAYNFNWGFPWTTGNVIVRGTGLSYYLFNPQGGSFSLTGFDTTTPMGQRNIQMVAGAVAQSTTQGPNGTANYSIMRLPEPGGALPLLSGALGLLAVAAWRTRKS